MTKASGWLKKTVVSLILLGALSGFAAAQSITDVPSSHWAYEAVRELVQKGYLTLESGRFDGDQPVDRFTLATVVARILNEIESGGATPQSEEDVDLLRKVVNEFRGELVRVFAELESVGEDVTKNDRNIGVVEDTLSVALDRLGQLAERSAELEAQLVALEAALEDQLAEAESASRTELGATTSAIRLEIGQLAELLQAERDARASLQAEVFAMIDSLREEALEGIAQNRLQIEQSQQQIALNQQEIAQNRELLQQHQQQIAQNEQAIADNRQQLEQQIAQNQQTIADNTQQIEENRQQIGDARNRIVTLEEAFRSELEAQGIELGDLQGRFAQTTSQIESELNRLKSALEAEIQHQLQLEKERLAQLADGVEMALAEVRSELNVQAEGLLAQRIALEQQRNEIEARIQEIEAQLESQTSAMAQADGELLRSIDELSRSVAALQTQVDAAAALADRVSSTEGRIEGVERQILAMQSQIGLSEEQLSALSDRLMNELESQFQHSFLLSGQVAQELDSLRSEFNSYRQSTEESLSRANQAQMFGIIGALLGLIGMVAK